MAQTELHWGQDAACGGDPRYMEDSPSPTTLEGMRGTCASCPVRETCLQAAMRREVGLMKCERWGVRGGLSARERHDMMLFADECVICGHPEVRGPGEWYAGACDPCADEVRADRKAMKRAFDRWVQPKLRCIWCSGPVYSDEYTRCISCAKESRDNWYRMPA